MRTAAAGCRRCLCLRGSWFYLMARRCFEATGSRCLATPVDEHGLDIASLPQEDRVRLAYVTSSHQFPLGGVPPISRSADQPIARSMHANSHVLDIVALQFIHGNASLKNVSAQKNAAHASQAWTSQPPDGLRCCGRCPGTLRIAPESQVVPCATLTS